nr:phosphomannomutase [Ipomoea batatas]
MCHQLVGIAARKSEMSLNNMIRLTRSVNKWYQSFEKNLLTSTSLFPSGDQISFDVFPQGWDKTYCLRYLEEFNEIHFFGDKTYKGGNDYEIFESERTVGHTVTSPDDTAEQCRDIFL